MRCDYRILAGTEGWREPIAAHGEVALFSGTLIECRNVAVKNGRCLFHDDGEVRDLDL
jgi:hypothetical protein